MGLSEYGDSGLLFLSSATQEWARSSAAPLPCVSVATLLRRHFFDLKTSVVHKSVKCRAVAQSGACTAQQDDVLYSVLVLGSITK